MPKIGNQTPTQSVILPYKKSLYKKAIEIYEKSGRKAQKWQKNLVKHILAINEEKLWTHTKFGYSLPRRNGKNEIVVIRELYGLLNGEKILHTAHRTTTSHSAWERLVMILEKAKYTNGQDFTTLRAVGRERVEFANGGRVEFRTRTSTGGLGEGFDTLIIDEAQEYTDDQESALKYVVTDSKNPQTLFCGTPPTLVSSGTVFFNLRNKALDVKAKNTGWAEWSVENESDVNDKDLWYLTNPSLGTIFTERSVEDEIGEDTIDFNIQRLGLWIKYNQKSAITEKDWEALKIESIPKFEGGLHVGIKFGRDGKNVSLSIAVKTKESSIFIESIDCQNVRNGFNWIVQFLKEADVANIVIDGAGNQEILKKELEDFKIRNIVLPTVKQVIISNSIFEKGIYEKSILHNDQPSLTSIATNVDKRNIGTNGGFGYSSIYDDKDVSLLDSCILAYWSCTEFKERKKQKVYY